MMRKKRFLLAIASILLFGCGKHDSISLYFSDKEVLNCNYKLYKNNSDNVYIEINESKLQNKKLVFDSVSLYLNNEKFEVCKIEAMKIDRFCDFVFAVDTINGELIHYKCDEKILFLISSGLNYKKRFDVNKLEIVPSCYTKKESYSGYKANLPN